MRCITCSREVFRRGVGAVIAEGGGVVRGPLGAEQGGGGWGPGAAWRRVRAGGGGFRPDAARSLPPKTAACAPGYVATPHKWG